MFLNSCLWNLHMFEQKLRTNPTLDFSIAKKRNSFFLSANGKVIVSKSGWKTFLFTFCPLCWSYRAPEGRAIVPTKTTSLRNTHVSRPKIFSLLRHVFQLFPRNERHKKIRAFFTSRVNIFEIKLSAYFLSAHHRGETV